MAKRRRSSTKSSLFPKPRKKPQKRSTISSVAKDLYKKFRYDSKGWP